MVRVSYVATVDIENTIHIFRHTETKEPDCDAPEFFLVGLKRDSAESGSRLALALLRDCFKNDGRARRLYPLFADLLVSPLLLRSNWILTNEDIEDAVQAIESREGWLWLESGSYLDEEP